jgi:uncharacterized membrane protein
MQILMPVHIVAGSLGLISGFIALYAAKGQPLHRKVGTVFVCGMLTMGLSGTAIAAISGTWAVLNIPAGLTTAYLVATGFTTLRPPARGARALSVGAMLLALAVGLFTLSLGLQAIAAGGSYRGMPAFPFLMFSVIATLGSIGDLRMLRSGGVTGVTRIRRHLWRMSVALFVAAMSFFIGQADVIPKPIRIMPLLALPPLAVLVTMLFWLRRIRIRRSVRVIAHAAPEVA